jgi:hypothetical protein
MSYQDSIYTTAGNMGKSGVRARRQHVRQQALEKALRELALPAPNPITPKKSEATV